MMVEELDEGLVEVEAAALPVPVEDELSPETDVEEVTGSELAVLKKELVRLSYSFKVNKLTRSAYWCSCWWQIQRLKRSQSCWS